MLLLLIISTNNITTTRVLYGLCLYDKFDCNFGKIMDNGSGRDSEKGSNATTNTTNKRGKTGDNFATADAVSDGMANEAQMAALQYLAEHGDEADKSEAMDIIRQKAGLPRRILVRK